MASPRKCQTRHPPSSEFDHARAEVILQESDFARPDGEIKAGGRVRCSLQACEHREMSNYGREAEFFARTDPADSRNVESQRGLLRECGLVSTVLAQPDHPDQSVRHVPSHVIFLTDPL